MGSKIENSPLVCGLTITETGCEVPEHPFCWVLTVYVPLELTVIEAPDSPVLHTFPEVVDAVKRTVCPWQKVNGPEALMEMTGVILL